MTEQVKGRAVRRGVVLAVALAVVVLLVLVFVPRGPDPDPPERDDEFPSVTQEDTGERTVVTGRVTDADGEPLAGVTVWGISSTTAGLLPLEALAQDRLGDELRARRLGSRTRTDADGTYRLRFQAKATDRHRLAFEPGDDAHAWAFSGGAGHVSDASEVGASVGEVALDVELPVAAEVSGRAVGEWPRSGHSGWTVAAVRTDGAVPRVVREVALGSRDWTLDGLAPGTYRIRAGADGTDRGAVVTLSAGERRDDVEVEIDHDGQVGGRVVDARGDAVGSVDVFVVRAGPAARGEDGVVARRRTDDSGRWNATLPAGEYTVHLHAAPRSCFTVAADEVAVSAGSTTTHEAVADDRGRIAGKVTWRTGMPYVGLSVRRADGSPAGRCSVWLPDVRMHDREFALTGLPEGTYRLDFVDPNGMALRAVARDGRSPQHFRMRDGADLADFDLRLERRAPRT